MLEDKNQSYTSLEELGEFGLIDYLTKDFTPKNPSTKLGIGDDAAQISFSSEKQTLISTDMLVEGIHFDLGYTPLKHLGYKSVVVNLSDIFAMNAQPSQITVSIACSNRFTVEAIGDLYQGIYRACDLYGVDLVGGDTTASNQGLVISITAIGHAETNKITTRKGANPSDLICVSGDLGAAYVGYQILKREQVVFKENPLATQPDLSSYEYPIHRQLMPDSRPKIIEELAAKKILPTAMIDVSDGLSSELEHLVNNSKIGYKIFEDKLPIDPTTVLTAEELNLNPTTVALNGGEDYELLFTVGLEHHQTIQQMEGVSIIGHTLEDKRQKVMVTQIGQEIEIKKDGWTVFRKED